MHEVPHRVLVDLQAASGKLRNEPAYGEIAVLDPLLQPDRVVARNPFGLLPPIWAAGPIEPLHPTDLRADRPPNCLAARLRGIPPSIAATTRLRRSKE